MGGEALMGAGKLRDLMGHLLHLQAQEAEGELYNAPWGWQGSVAKGMKSVPEGMSPRSWFLHLVATTKTKRCLLRSSQASNVLGAFLEDTGCSLGCSH